MKRTRLHALNPESARKRIKAAKSNEPFMAALLDRGHREHKDAVDQWTRLHEIAFAEPTSSHAISRTKPPGRMAARNVPSWSEFDGRGSEHGRSPDGRTRPRPGKSRHQANADGNVQRNSEAVSEGRGEAEPPVLNKSSDRIRALQDDTDALFEIEENDEADRYYGAGRSDHRLGAEAVGRYASIIEEEARRQGVDPDWVKAIMYVENAHGYYGNVPQAFGMARTLLPMNINPELWSVLSDPPADLNDPEMNIRNAVTLIRRITERVDEPTLAKVASIWIFAGAEQVGDYGARVQDVYDRELWEEPFTPLPSLSIDAP